MKNRIKIGTLAALCATTLSVHAQDLVNLGVEIEGWDIQPLADVDGITHLIVARIDDAERTTDIDAVLYTLETDGSWSAEAYDPQMTKADALRDLSIEFSLPDPSSGDGWLIDVDPEDFIDYIVPRQPFGKGFFVTDPLYMIAHQVDDPEQLAEAAEQEGVAAASSAANTGAVFGGGGGTGAPGTVGMDCGCDDLCIQDAIADGASALIDDPSMSVSEVDSVIGDSLEARLMCCLPRITRCIHTYGSWNCSGWQFQGTLQTTGGVLCIYKRDVFRQQSRNCIRVCFNCNSFTFNQSRLQSGTEEQRTSATNSAACAPPPSGGCGSRGGNWSYTNWSPPPPACP